MPTGSVLQNFFAIVLHPHSIALHTCNIINLACLWIVGLFPVFPSRISAAMNNKVRSFSTCASVSVGYIPSSDIAGSTNNNDS